MRSLLGSHVTIVVLLGLLAAGSVRAARDVRRDTTPIRFDAALPARADAWVRATGVGASAEVNVDRLVSARYARADGARLRFTIAASGDARRQFEMHYPDVCHEVRGDVVGDLGAAPVSAGGSSAWPARAFTWQQRSGNAGALCLYGVVFGSRAMPHSWSAKWTQMAASMAGSTLSGHMLRVDVFVPAATADRLAVARAFLTSLDSALDESMRAALFGTSPPTEIIKENLR